MTESGHGLQIVSVVSRDGIHEYTLEQKELEQLLLSEAVKDLPVVVVSVAGAYRGGKSFLLNFFLRYLTAPQNAREDGSWLGEDGKPLAGFTWRSGIKATTMGILMWSEPFITSLPSGEKVAILLVDTQGNFDSKSTVRDNTTIFALSTLVSSIQIYNLSGNIQEDDLQHLELFTEYGKLLNAGDPNKKAFQVLEFLVRDWCCAEDFSYGTVGGESYLRGKLEITDDLANEMKTLRQHINSSFEKVTCFLMPHPGFKVTKKAFIGTVNDIEPDFREYLKHLVNSIFSPDKLLPKTINEEKIKARDLFNYFKAYMELFNSNEIPSPSNIMAMTVKAGLLSAVSEARDVYEKGMDSECGPKELFMPAVDIKFVHDKYVKLAMESFSNKKKMGSEAEISEYLNKLKKEIGDGRLEQFLLSNKSKIQDAIERARDVYNKEFENVNKDKLLICLHQLDLDDVHKAAVEKATKIYDVAQKQRVTQAKNEEKEKFIRGFEKDYNLINQINEQNNNKAKTYLHEEYFKHMLAKAKEDPQLTDIEFRKEHKESKNRALANFDLKRNKLTKQPEDNFKIKLAQNIQNSFTKLKKINKSKNKDAIDRGIKAYNTYVEENWERDTLCLHPDEFEELHHAAVCSAIQVFHPRKQCADGFDDEDEDEFTMKETLEQQYQELKKNNDDANNTAVLLAYNEYVNSIDHDCKFSITWLLVIPYIVNRSNRGLYHRQAKSIAYEVFNGKRQKYGDTEHAKDAHKERLDKKMENYFTDNY